MPADPNRVENLYHRALALPPTEREALLAACDPDERKEVERLLASDAALETPSVPELVRSDTESASRLSPRSGQSTTDHIPQPDAGTVVGGKYKLLKGIGAGGMGSVWAADQTTPVRRSVAVKLVKPGMDSRQVLARFEAERQALALMDHPNIAKVFDAGIHDGRPFFVMELVKGVPITTFCDDRKLTPRQRLELFIPVCQAIQHAHQKAIIHRDIKPSNVLVAVHDDKPVPKVIDFGIAKAAGQPLTDSTLHTVSGSLVGTPQYMSPEQAKGDPDIDTRSDVYSLGVLLYELLAGSPPFTQRGLLDILRAVQEAKPQKPSEKLSTAGEKATLTANRGTEPRKLTALLQGELDCVVMKALEKDRTRRYESAAAFAADVRRYLDGEPVLAHPPGVAYRVRKFVRRNRGAVSSVAAILVVAAVAVWLYVERSAEDERRRGAERVRLIRNGETAADLLARCKDALRADDPETAELLLAQAADRIKDGGGEHLHDLTRRCQTDLARLKELDQIDNHRWTTRDGLRLDDAGAVVRWAGLFRGIGVVPGETAPVEAARVLGESVVRERLLGALDLWLVFDRTAPLPPILQAADPDRFRASVRQATSSGDGATLAELAGRPAALAQPPWFAAALGQNPSLAGDHQKRILQAALSERPDNLTVLMALGHLNPINQLKGAADRVRWYQAAVTARPSSVGAWYSLGVALLDLGDSAGAVECHTRAIRLDARYAPAHVGHGNALKVRGELRDAVAAYDAAIRLEKTCDAYNGLGLARLASGDVDGALAALRESLRLAPNHPITLSNLGKALMDKGELGAAIERFRESIQADPTFAQAHGNLGTALRRDGDIEGAIAAQREAVRLEPTATHHYNLGVALADERKGDVDGAIASYREAVRLDPAFFRAYHNLGSQLAKKGNLNGATEAYREAIRIHPKYASAHYNLGLALSRQPLSTDPTEMLAAFRAAVLHDPKNSAYRTMLERMEQLLKK